MNVKRVFPISKIQKGAKIVLYGAGNNGREMYEQNRILNWCNILSVVDREYKEIKDFPLRVESPNVLKTKKYDYVVVSLVDHSVRMQIFDDLLKLGISEEKIIIDTDAFLISDYGNNILERREEGCCNDRLVIGFFPGGVMGDNIISLRLYQELVHLAPDAIIDVFTPFSGFPSHVFYGQKNLRKIIIRYPTIEDRWHYDLIIQSHFEPSLIYGNLYRIEKLAPELSDRIKILYAYQTTDFFMCSPTTYMNRIQWDRSKFMGYTSYTLLNASGAFDINDYHVDLLIDESYKDEYYALGLTEKYITFSYGVSDPLKNGKKQTKMWPEEYYVDLNRMLKKRFSTIKIVQTDAGNVKKVAGADRYIMGENLEIVKLILKNALCHIDCEGGLVHMATQLGTKCFVVFGPTPVSYFGYECNVNFAPKVCGECCGLTRDWYTRCYKYDDAKCMRSTKPEEVFAEVSRYVLNKMKRESDK